MNLHTQHLANHYLDQYNLTWSSSFFNKVITSNFEASVFGKIPFISTKSDHIKKVLNLHTQHMANHCLDP